MKNKKVRFAVRIDELGRNKLYLQKLVEIITDNYSFLTQESRYTRSRAIGKARNGDVIVFGGSKKYDFTTVSYKEFQELYGNFTALPLARQFAEVKRRLRIYASNNQDYITDINLDFVYYKEPKNSFRENVYYVEDIPRKKKKTSRPKDLELVEARVFFDHVQVGWDDYTIYENDHGDEYAVIDGNLRWIERDSAGLGILTVR